MIPPLFRERIQISFRLADPAGILFFGNFFDLAHDILERFLQHRGITWAEWFNHPTLAFPIRHAESDFHAPLKAGESYDVEASVVETSSSSVTFQVSFLSDGIPRAQTRIVSVCIRRNSGEKERLPSELVARLRA